MRQHQAVAIFAVRNPDGSVHIMASDRLSELSYKIETQTAPWSNGYMVGEIPAGPNRVEITAEWYDIDGHSVHGPDWESTFRDLFSRWKPNPESHDQPAVEPGRPTLPRSTP